MSARLGSIHCRGVNGIGLFLIFLLAVIALTPSAEARGGHSGKGHKFVRELNLTEPQLAQFKAIKSKYHSPHLSESRKQLKEAKKDLIASLQAPKRGEEYDAELMKKFKKVQELKSAQHQRRFEMALEIRAILTDEQIAKFKALPKREHRGGAHFDED